MGVNVKMQTVARIAGVSQSAVSKVLNNRPGVSEDTRKRVREVCADLGYEFQPRASSRPAPIEVVFRTITSALNPLLISGLNSTLSGSPHPMAVVGADTDSPGWIDDIVSRRPAGVILVVSPLPPNTTARFAEANIPAVVLDTIGGAPAGLSAVGSTHWRGGYLAARHLVELGHRRLAMISGPSELICSIARVSGFFAALQERGIAPDPVVASTFQAEPSRAIALQLLQRENPPTAIVTGNDLQAIGVIDAAYELHLRIPDDLSIVGYDDQDAAARATPALTTIHQPLEQMAAEAGRILRRHIDDPRLLPVRLDLSSELVVRRTTARPRA